jgi:hypothetical protein
MLPCAVRDQVTLLETTLKEMKPDIAINPGRFSVGGAAAESLAAPPVVAAS